MSKLLRIALCGLLLVLGIPAPTYASQLATIDDFRGLQRNGGGDKIENGSHTKFDNTYIDDGNIKVIKGRDRLNSTAHTDTVVNGLFYYENSAGTVKKLVVKESDEVVTYDTDGTNRTSIYSQRDVPTAKESDNCFGSSTVLLLSMDGADASTTFTDESTSAHTVTANGDAQVDTAQSKFGGASLLLDGSDFLDLDSSTDWAVGTGDFQIDLWVRFSSTTGTQIFFEKGTGSQLTLSKTSGGALNLNMLGVNVYTQTWNPSTATWYHVALSREDSTIRAFINGTQLGTDIIDTSDVTSTQVAYIGANSGGGSGVVGWIDEFKFVKGKAEFVEDFTPWTTAYDDCSDLSPTLSQTSLANEPVDFVQIGDTLYWTSSTDGLAKWTGSGSASTVLGIVPVSPIDFNASNRKGGLTPGNDAIAVPDIVSASCNGGTYPNLRGPDNGGEDINCDVGDTGILEICANSSRYRYKITKYDSDFGVESEASPFTFVNLRGNNTITWAARNCVTDRIDSSNFCVYCTEVEYAVTGANTSSLGSLPSTIDDPFNSYRVYRTVASGEEYFLVADGEPGADFLDGKSDVGLATTLDTTINTIDPPKARYIGEYKGVLFVGEGTDLNFTSRPVASKTDMDTYWLETNQLQTGSKYSITGIQSTFDSLLVFTSNRVIEITGFGVESFRQKQLIDGVGSVNDDVIEINNSGDVIFFAGTQGVYKIRTSESRADEKLGALIDQSNAQIVRISTPVLDNVFNGTDTSIVLDPDDYVSSHAYYDLDQDLYWLFIGSDAFIFNNKNNQWSHIPGIQASASLYYRSPGNVGQGVLLDDLGYFWNNFTGYENGGTSGTITGNPTSSASTTLTDSGASFDTTNDGLAGVWVIVDNGSSLQYRRITANTSTQLTVESAWDTNPTTADTYYIGYIVFDILTKQYNLSKPPKETEVQAITIVNEKSAASQDLIISTYRNKSTTAQSPTQTVDLNSSNITKKLITVTGNWVQWGLRAFVHQTSNSIVPPVNIINYSIRALQREED